MHKIYDIEAVPPRLTIGRQGEANVEEIRFDYSNWIERFGEMEISVWITRPAETAAYPAKITRDDNVITWVVSAVDAAFAGEGSVEVLGIINDKRKLSAKIITHVLPSALDNTTDVPEGGNLWAADVLDAAERVENAVVHPPIIAENGNWWLWDFDKGEYADSGKPSAGAGGNGGGESGSGSFVVTVAYDRNVSGLVADKTKEEIIEAFNNGIPCMAVRDEGSVKTILHPYRVEDYFVGFSTTSYIYDEYMTIEKLDFNEYDEIISSSYDIPFGGGGGGWE